MTEPTPDLRALDSAEDELPPPTGTLFVMMLYLMVLAGMWGAIYWMFLER